MCSTDYMNSQMLIKKEAISRNWFQVETIRISCLFGVNSSRACGLLEPIISRGFPCMRSSSPFEPPYVYNFLEGYAGIGILPYLSEYRKPYEVKASSLESASLYMVRAGSIPRRFITWL